MEIINAAGPSRRVVSWMYTDAFILSDEAARIIAISEDIEFAVVAGCADVIWAYDTTNTFQRDLDTSFDSCWSHVLTSPAVFSFLGQRKSGWPQSLRLASPIVGLRRRHFGRVSTLIDWIFCSNRPGSSQGGKARL